MTIVPLLTAKEIDQKLKRMAFEIWEKNSEEKEISIIGIEEIGAVVAKMIADILQQISPLKVKLTTLTINKRNPLQDEIVLSTSSLTNKTVVLIDDVANSGKTLLYAIKPLLDHGPKKIQIAVLVDRKHKNYPITPDIIGHSVSTTLQENIMVTFDGEKLTGAHLE